MIRALVLLFTIILLGAPSALVFIPWAAISGNVLPLYTAALTIVRIGYWLVRVRIVTTGLENVSPNTACIVHVKPRVQISIRRRCCREFRGAHRHSSRSR